MQKVVSWIKRLRSHFSSKTTPSKKTDPTAALESLERWSALATLIILVGIVAEACVTINFRRPGESNFEVYATLLADGAVGAGLIIEVVCILRAIFEARREKRESDLKVAEANERAVKADARAADAIKAAGEANERAAKAHERAAEIEKITAWRRVSPEQHGQIVDDIKGVMASLDLLIEFQMSDPEAYLFAREIADVFVAAGVGQIRLCANSYISGDVFGIHMAASPGIDGAFISSAFDRAGISIPIFKKDLSTHLMRSEVAPNLYIFVGPKPPLRHDAMARAVAGGTSSATATSAATRDSCI